MPNSEDDAKDNLNQAFKRLPNDIEDIMDYAKEHRLLYYANELFMKRVQPVLKRYDIDCTGELILQEDYDPYESPMRARRPRPEPEEAPGAPHKRIRHRGGRTRRLNRRR
jgi:hypothetical protein